MKFYVIFNCCLNLNLLFGKLKFVTLIKKKFKKNLMIQCKLYEKGPQVTSGKDRVVKGDRVVIHDGKHELEDEEGDETRIVDETRET